MIKFISVGKVKDKNLNSLILQYAEKIDHYHKIKLIDVKDESIIKNLESKIKETEAERVLKYIENDDYVIVLDLNGKQLKSEDFSKKIDSLVNQSKNIVFIVGGSLGIGESLMKRANESLKLSEMTFIHNMALLIILEQVYRAFKIIRNESYHK